MAPAAAVQPLGDLGQQVGALRGLQPAGEDQQLRLRRQAEPAALPRPGGGAAGRILRRHRDAVRHHGEAGFRQAQQRRGAGGDRGGDGGPAEGRGRQRGEDGERRLGQRRLRLARRQVVDRPAPAARPPARPRNRPSPWVGQGSGRMTRSGRVAASASASAASWRAMLAASRRLGLPADAAPASRRTALGQPSMAAKPASSAGSSATVTATPAAASALASAALCFSVPPSPVEGRAIRARRLRPADHARPAAQDQQQGRAMRALRQQGEAGRRARRAARRIRRRPARRGRSSRRPESAASAVSISPFPIGRVEEDQVAGAPGRGAAWWHRPAARGSAPPPGRWRCWPAARPARRLSFSRKVARGGAARQRLQPQRAGAGEGVQHPGILDPLAGRAQGACHSMSNSACRTRSAVGRVAWPAGRQQAPAAMLPGDDAQGGCPNPLGRLGARRATPRRGPRPSPAQPLLRRGVGLQAELVAQHLRVAPPRPRRAAARRAGTARRRCG